ncbi:hypothetical protein AB0I55_26215 [Actinocatenispora sera]|uniref:hypothetical protein n=1 Tax=Actinocatenispora sera TaxID=390989 RepID=UPI0033FD2AFC
MSIREVHMLLTHAASPPRGGLATSRLTRIAAVIAVIAAALLATALSTPANAAPSAQPFVAQARAAGYTTAQANALQRQVDHYLKVVGGRQVAINEIDYPGGHLVGPLPGEKYARELGTAQPNGWDANCQYPSSNCYGCPYYNFCMFQGPAFTGWRNDLKACTKVGVIWKMMGSWADHQTSGKDTTFYTYYAYGEGVWGTTTAPSSSSRYDWSKVTSIKPC